VLLIIAATGCQTERGHKDEDHRLEKHLLACVYVEDEGSRRLGCRKDRAESCPYPQGNVSNTFVVYVVLYCSRSSCTEVPIGFKGLEL
jgi:hypothetical protein